MSELTAYFADYIEVIAHEQNEKAEQIVNKIRYWYNGYRFSSAPRIKSR